MRSPSRNPLGRSLLLACLASAATLALTAALGGRAEARWDAGCPDAGKAPRQLTMHQMRSAVLCVVNRLRRHHDLRPLEFSEQLRRSATAHSIDMVVHDYFGHDGLHGSTLGDRIAHAGYLSRVNTYFVGENIGGGMGRRLGSPAAVCRAWMRSPSHRANILSPGFRDFGIGVARGFPGGLGARAATYTLDFGARR